MDDDSATIAEASLAKATRPEAAPSRIAFDTQWARVRGRLQDEVGEVEYRTWLRQMTLVGMTATR